jgi:hypothetical protein
MKLNTEPMYIAVLLENTDEAIKRQAWLTLPATTRRFAAVLQQIQAHDGNFRIAEYTHRVPGMSRKELKLASLAAVNYLAARLRKLTAEDITKLCAIWDSDHYFNTVGSLIDYTFDTDKYAIIPGIRDAEALGVRYLGKTDKVLAGVRHSHLIDRYEYGKKLAAMEKGVFTPHGYVTSSIGWDLPEAVRRIPKYLNLKGYLGEDLYGDWTGDYVG